MSGCKVVRQVSGTREKRGLLLIGLSHEDRAQIPHGENGVPCCVHQVESRSAALDALAEVAPSMIICEGQFGDGTWKDILAIASQLSPIPPVIVASRLADEHLWAEVLNLGGYDVLTLPFDSDEVNRITRAAWRFSERGMETHQPNHSS